MSEPDSGHVMAPLPLANSGKVGRLLAFVALLILVAGIAFQAAQIAQHRRYRASATIEVRYEGDEAERQRFLVNQVKLMRAPEMLEPVIDQLNSAQAYAGGGVSPRREPTVEQLQKSMTVRQVRGTNLVEIGMEDEDANLAANIANLLALTYRNWRLQDLEKWQSRGLAQFQDEVNRQRQAVDESQHQLTLLPTTETGGEKRRTAEVNLQQKQQILESAEVALSKARMEKEIDQEAVTIRQKAEPPLHPLPWWHR